MPSLPHALSLLSRDQIVAILQNQGGYRCYDDEGTDYLREILLKDIETGVLPASILAQAEPTARAPAQ